MLFPNLAQVLLRWPKKQHRFWETAAANFRALFSGPDPRNARNLLQDRILERLAVRLHDAADSRDYEFTRSTLGFLHRELEELVKKGCRGFLRRAEFLGDVRNDLGFAQRLGCHLVFLSS